MKRKIYRTLLGLLPALLMFVGVVTFMSCTEEEGVSTLSGPVPVYLHVSADILGDLNATRAAGNDDNAESGEFMNTLCVFVVDENDMIEAKFGPDILEAYSDAATGNLTDWTSDKLTLTTGKKTIYAFSNWQTADSENGDWAKLIAKEVGTTISDTELAFTVDDPASKVDIANGKYIPMSGKETVTVERSADFNYNQLIEVGLDRLVGKVTIAINGETSALDNEGNETAQAVTLGDLTFEGWADVVPLMSDDKTEYDIKYTGYIPLELNQTIAVGSSATIASFYVNETYGANPTDVSGTSHDGFYITLDTDRYGGTYYTATTANKDIPRNYIYPIRLTLDQNVFNLAVTAWTDPLGIEEVPYYNYEIDGNSLIITLFDVTSTFQLTPSMLYNGTALQTVTWNWTYYNTGDGSVCTIDEDKDSDSYGVVTVTSLTATPGYEYGFRLIVDWTTTSTSNVTTTHSRTYTIHVRFVEGWPQFQSPAQRTWRTKDARSEVVNLLLNK